MADDSRARLLLIVTGSTLRAEDVDRPLAYYLKQQVEALLTDREVPFVVRVVADFRWLYDEPLQGLPTISLGGPGVNALAHRWRDEVPFILIVEGRYFIQMDTDSDELRASVWGMDNATTQIATYTFIQGFLPRFLDRCAAIAPDLSDLDDAE